jgi:hypothetical protein
VTRALGTRGEHLRFTSEPGEAIGIVGDGGPQDFDRDLAVQRRVTGLVHLAHSAHADPRRELIRADAPTLEGLPGAGGHLFHPTPVIWREGH